MLRIFTLAPNDGSNKCASGKGPRAWDLYGCVSKMRWTEHCLKACKENVDVLQPEEERDRVCSVMNLNINLVGCIFSYSYCLLTNYYVYMERNKGAIMKVTQGECLRMAIGKKYI